MLNRGDVPVVADVAWPESARYRLVAAVQQRLTAPSPADPAPLGARPDEPSLGARLDEPLMGAPRDEPSLGALPDEPLLVVLTSGSTGAPRAVVRTLASWTASYPAFEAAAGVRAEDVVWAPGALSSTLTLFAARHAAATGRELVASGPWHGVGAALAAGAGRATLVHAVPAVVADVLDAVAAGLLPRLRTVVVAGAHPPSGMCERAAALGVRTVEYYGAAELSFVTVAGRPIAGAEVRLDADGVIWVRSPYVSLGYVGPGDVGARDSRAADAQAAAGGAHRDAPLRRRDGWATVGDRGHMLPDGTLEVLGRGEGTVTVGGHTVCVTDIEAALRSVPGVRELACAGEPHPRLGQRLVGIVSAQPGTDPRPALRAAARQALPRAARPARWVLVDDLPRTPHGKIARAHLLTPATEAS